jgi:hypothetical protein
VLAGGQSVGGSRSRERIIQDKEFRKQSSIQHRESELERIRLENVRERQEAAQRQENMYRHSANNYPASQAPNSGE